MNPRGELLQAVKQGLTDQVISPQDLKNILDVQSGEVVPVLTTPQAPVPPAVSEPDKHALSIIDVLFYLAGIILFAAVTTLSFQVEDDSPARYLICLIAGVMFWSASFFLSRQTTSNDNRQGLIQAMILTGSLSLITGIFVLTTNIIDNQLYSSDSSASSSTDLIYAFVLVVLSAAHFLFDRLLRSGVLICLSLLLFVAAFPTAMVGLLADMEPAADVWGIVGILTGILLAFGGKLVARSAPGREDYDGAFESVAGFVVMANIYVLGLASNIAVFWELVLPLAIYGAFFISIKRRSKQFLVTGSLFLVLFLITMSFKYFSGIGAAFSLILSAFSILCTAFVASGINKKYIKPDAEHSA